MFCDKCGAEYDENAKFCPKCGAPTANFNPSDSRFVFTDTNTVQKKKPYYAITLITAIIVAAVLLILKFTLFANSYLAPVNNIVKGIERQDASLVMATVPDPVLREIEKEYGWDADQTGERFEELFKEGLSIYGDSSIEIKYETKEITKLSQSDIADLESAYENTNIHLDITAARAINLDWKIYKDGKLDNTIEDMNITVIKTGGKWYIDYESM